MTNHYEAFDQVIDALDGQFDRQSFFKAMDEMFGVDLERLQVRYLVVIVDKGTNRPKVIRWAVFNGMRLSYIAQLLSDHCRPKVGRHKVRTIVISGINAKNEVISTTTVPAHVDDDAWFQTLITITRKDGI